MKKNEIKCLLKCLAQRLSNYNLREDELRQALKDAIGSLPIQHKHLKKKLLKSFDKYHSQFLKRYSKFARPYVQNTLLSLISKSTIENAKLEVEILKGFEKCQDSMSVISFLKKLCNLIVVKRSQPFTEVIATAIFTFFESELKKLMKNMNDGYPFSALKSAMINALVIIDSHSPSYRNNTASATSHLQISAIYSLIIDFAIVENQSCKEESKCLEIGNSLLDTGCVVLKKSCFLFLDALLQLSTLHLSNADLILAPLYQHVLLKQRWVDMELAEGIYLQYVVTSRQASSLLSSRKPALSRDIKVTASLVPAPPKLYNWILNRVGGKEFLDDSPLLPNTNPLVVSRCLIEELDSDALDRLLDMCNAELLEEPFSAEAKSHLEEKPSDSIFFVDKQPLSTNGENRGHFVASSGNLPPNEDSDFNSEDELLRETAYLMDDDVTSPIARQTTDLKKKKKKKFENVLDGRFSVSVAATPSKKRADKANSSSVKRAVKVKRMAVLRAMLNLEIAKQEVKKEKKAQSKAKSKTSRKRLDATKKNGKTNSAVIDSEVKALTDRVLSLKAGEVSHKEFLKELSNLTKLKKSKLSKAKPNLAREASSNPTERTLKKKEKTGEKKSCEKTEERAKEKKAGEKKKKKKDREIKLLSTAVKTSNKTVCTLDDSLSDVVTAKRRSLEANSIVGAIKQEGAKKKKKKAKKRKNPSSIEETADKRKKCKLSQFCEEVKEFQTQFALQPEVSSFPSSFDETTPASTEVEKAGHASIVSNNDATKNVLEDSVARKKSKRKSLKKRRRKLLALGIENGDVLAAVSTEVKKRKSEGSKVSGSAKGASQSHLNDADEVARSLALETSLSTKAETTVDQNGGESRENATTLGGESPKKSQTSQLNFDPDGAVKRTESTGEVSLPKSKCKNLNDSVSKQLEKQNESSSSALDVTMATIDLIENNQFLAELSDSTPCGVVPVEGGALSQSCESLNTSSHESQSATSKELDLNENSLTLNESVFEKAREFSNEKSTSSRVVSPKKKKKRSEEGESMKETSLLNSELSTSFKLEQRKSLEKSAISSSGERKKNRIPQEGASEKKSPLKDESFQFEQRKSLNATSSGGESVGKKKKKHQVEILFEVESEKQLSILSVESSRKSPKKQLSFSASESPKKKKRKSNDEGNVGELSALTIVSVKGASSETQSLSKTADESPAIIDLTERKEVPIPPSNIDTCQMQAQSEADLTDHSQMQGQVGNTDVIGIAAEKTASPGSRKSNTAIRKIQTEIKSDLTSAAEQTGTDDVSPAEMSKASEMASTDGTECKTAKESTLTLRQSKRSKRMPNRLKSPSMSVEAIKGRTVIAQIRSDDVQSLSETRSDETSDFSQTTSSQSDYEKTFEPSRDTSTEPVEKTKRKSVKSAKALNPMKKERKRAKQSSKHTAVATETDDTISTSTTDDVTNVNLTDEIQSQSSSDALTERKESDSLAEAERNNEMSLRRSRRARRKPPRLDSPNVSLLKLKGKTTVEQHSTDEAGSGKNVLEHESPENSQSVENSSQELANETAMEISDALKPPSKDDVCVESVDKLNIEVDAVAKALEMIESCLPQSPASLKSDEEFSIVKEQSHQQSLSPILEKPGHPSVQSKRKNIRERTTSITSDSGLRRSSRISESQANLRRSGRLKS